MKVELDLVIPIYEAQDQFPLLINRLNEWVKRFGRNIRLILVEDGSKNSFEHELAKLNCSFPIKYARLAKNYGQHTATAVGLNLSEADLVATIDDDLQHDPFELEKMLEQMQKSGSDLIYGKFEQKKQSSLKNIGSRIVNLLFQVENPHFKGVTSFRLMKQEVLQVLKQHKSPTYLVDEYLLRSSSKKEEVGVIHYNSEREQSNYKTKDLFLFTTKLILYHSSIPLKFIIRLGLLIALSCIFLALYFIYMKFTYGSVLGFSALIVAILFSTGILMITLGIIGEYIKKIWQEQMKLNEVVISSTKEYG